MDGIFCINKPAGWTSFDVVAKARGISGTKKVGHAGTLDPMATGVLPLLFGNATKACDILPNDEKGYLAEFRLGVTTDTLDRTGTVLSTQESRVTREEVEHLLPEFTGTISQLPPMYSAVRVNGRRLYDLARNGETVERKPRTVAIRQLRLLSFDEAEQTGRLEVLCSKGTYIRTLCGDLGERLGCGAMLTELVRSSAGDFTLDDCHTLEEMQHLADAGRLQEAMLPVETVFASLPEIRLSEAQAAMFRNGVRLDLRRLRWQDQDGPHRVFRRDGLFLGLASLNREKMELVIEKMFQRD